MDFLTLVQALQEESGSGGSAITTIVGATGETLRLRNWIARADLAIQAQFTDWKFLHVEDDSTTTGSGTADYAAPSDLRAWDRDSFRVEASLVDRAVEWNIRDYPLPTSSGQPSEIFILPDNQLRVHPVPDGAYTILGNYWKKPVQLDSTDDTDTPQIPTEFHPLIVYVALSYYANWEQAPEIKRQAQEGYDFWWPLLVASQAPHHSEGTMSSGNNIVITAE